MEFIKVGDNYLIKDSNNVIVNEEEKLKIERLEELLKKITEENAEEEKLEELWNNIKL